MASFSGRATFSAVDQTRALAASTFRTAATLLVAAATAGLTAVTVQGAALEIKPPTRPALAKDISKGKTPVHFPANSEVLYPTLASSFVVVGSFSHGKDGCEVWNLETMKKTGGAHEAVAAGATKKALSPDGKLFASNVNIGSNPGVAVWSMETGQQVQKFEAHASPVFLELFDFVGPDLLLTSLMTSPARQFKLWEASTGKLVREFAGPQLFEADSRAISPDGRYLAIFRDKQALVYDLTTGEQAGEFRLPFDLSGYTGCKGMSFSPDGKELIGVFHNNQQTLLFGWSTASGELATEDSFPGDLKMSIQSASSYKGAPIDWIAGGKALLLYGHEIIDRESGRLVWMLESAPNDISPLPRKMLDQDRLLVATSAVSQPGYLEVVRVDWEKIAAAAKVLDSDAAAYVKPGQAVSLKVDVGAVRAGTPEETKAALIQVLTERLEADEIKVADGQPTVLEVKYREEAGKVLNEFVNQGGGAPFNPLNRRNMVATGRTVQATRAVCNLAYRATGTAKPLWSNEIEFDPNSLLVRGDATDAKARESVFGVLKLRLVQQPIPYFVPKDASLSALPGSSKLPGVSQQQQRSVRRKRR